MIAWIVRFFVSALVLMLAVKVVTPQNARNTLQRALVASFIINVAAVPLLWMWWFFLIPLVLYVLIWFATLMGSYDIGPIKAVGIGIVGAVLSWLVDFLIGRQATL